MNSPLVLSVAEKPDVGFVACIEGGMLEGQTLLLFDSIRLHTGRFRDCSLYALSPRAGYPISPDARRRLNDLGAHYIDTIPQYGMS
jgi:hypothetical protein